MFVMNEEFKDDFEFVLNHTFHHVPAGHRKSGDFKGMPYDEFWWQRTIDGDGYVMVWLSGGTFSKHHTYHYPPNIYD